MASRSTIHTFVCVVVYFGFTGTGLVAMDVDDFFPQIDGDYSNVTWDHAVNSWAALNESLNSTIMMLEADVSLGHVIGQSPDIKIPIMAHPPDVESDISLDAWLSALIDDHTKGAKLDFKSTEVLEPSLQILKNRMQEIVFPVWINADILPGPVNATTTPVNSSVFLEMCKANFPQSTVSPGWTTYVNISIAKDERQYSWENFIDMALALRDADIEQSVTFPVRAVFVGLSMDRLEWLVDSVASSSLTVWSGSSDLVNVSDLFALRTRLALDKAFYDLPGLLNVKFSSGKNLPDNRPSDVPTQCASPLSPPYFQHDSNAIAGSRAVVLLDETPLNFSYPFKKIVKQQLILKGILEFLSSPSSDAPMSDEYIVISFGPTDSSQMRIHGDGRVEVPNWHGGWNVIEEGTSQFAFDMFLSDSLGNRVTVRLQPLDGFIDNLPYNDTYKAYPLYRATSPAVQFQFISTGIQYKVLSQLKSACLPITSRASAAFSTFICLTFVSVAVAILVQTTAFF